jgi:rsbT co-antagonist protein RsbR
MKSGNHDDIQDAEWTASRELLGDYSRSRAVQGFTPAETATFIFSMKEPVFALCVSTATAMLDSSRSRAGR